MDPGILHRMFLAARAEGVTALAAFLGLCTVYSERARGAIREALDGPLQRVERNIPPGEAAQRLGISLRKLTRERFTTYRDICFPIDGQTRGYVVNEKALEVRLARMRAERG